jgi:hypothetical protein
MAEHPIYRFYAELAGYVPKIWRRFEVNGRKTMAELGYILMTMFEMKASHLFGFTYDCGAKILEDLRKCYSNEELSKVLGRNDIADLVKPLRFELPADEIYENADENLQDASQYRLTDISDTIPWKLTFTYDYGDNWQVNLTLECCEKVEIYAGDLPRVLEGKGFGIIEDCGGIGGLAELAKAFKKKKGQQYNEYREWLGTDYIDFTAFDIDDINYRLKKLPRIYKECYECGYEPTQRSIDLIDRAYKKDR